MEVGTLDLHSGQIGIGDCKNDPVRKPLGALKKIPGAGDYIAVVPGELASLVNARLRAAGEMGASTMEIGVALREASHLQGEGRHSTRVGNRPINAWRLPAEWGSVIPK